MKVNPELKSHFEEKGFRFVGQDIEGERMEVIELDGKKVEGDLVPEIQFVQQDVRKKNTNSLVIHSTF